MQPTTLRQLLAHQRPAVSRQARVISDALARTGREPAEFLDASIVDLVAALKEAGHEDEQGEGEPGSELLAVEAAMVPLLQLHRMLRLAQPVEEQLEPSVLDVLSCEVTTADLEEAARNLGCGHLEAPIGKQPSQGLIIGPKNRILVCRNVTIRKETRCVVFSLNPSAPVSYVCHDTLRAFGVSPAELQSSNGVRACIEGGVRLDLYIFRPDGPHNDLNVLGMDYMTRSNAALKIDDRAGTVELEVH